MTTAAVVLAVMAWMGVTPPKDPTLQRADDLYNLPDEPLQAGDHEGWDNAVVERFLISLKLELVYTTDFATHEQARLALFEYIDVFYNRQRRHSSLGYVSPVDLPQKLAS